MPMQSLLKIAALLMRLGAATAVCAIATVGASSYAARPSKPAINDEISTVLAQMGKSLRTDQFSFQARTFRVYADSNGQPLHIAHSMKVTVRRPDRLMIDLTGDDGTKLYYDSKTLVIFGVETKRFVSIPVPSTIQAMIEK
jgi:hypothetical protein